MEITEHADLGSHTTFKVGGTVRYLLTAESVEDIVEAVSFAEERQLPLVVVGGGANMLIDDGEAEGVFLIPKIVGTNVLTREEGKGFVFSSGEAWDEVVEKTVAQKWWGFENLSGIPGTVGGAIVQNIGAYGAALSEHLLWVEAYDLQEKRGVRLQSDECAFEYRTSIFKEQTGRYVILRAGFLLTKEGVANLSYRDLSTHFEGREASLEEVREAVLAIRKRKFPDLSLEGTAGSFFKNPIVSETEASVLKAKYPLMPLFSMPETTGIKVPLAWILDHILSMRGFSIGPVRCFEEQPLVLVADRNAQAKDVRTLARFVQQQVEKETKIKILPEVCVMHGATMTNDVSI